MAKAFDHESRGEAPIGNLHIATSTNAAAQPCTQTFGTLNKSGTIFSTGSQNVICVQNIALGGGATLTLSIRLAVFFSNDPIRCGAC